MSGSLTEGTGQRSRCATLAIHAVHVLLLVAYLVGSGWVATWYVKRTVKLQPKATLKLRSLTLVTRADSKQLEPIAQLATAFENQIAAIEVVNPGRIFGLGDVDSPVSLVIAKPDLTADGAHIGLNPFALKDLRSPASVPIQLAPIEGGIQLNLNDAIGLPPEPLQLRIISHQTPLSVSLQRKSGKENVVPLSQGMPVGIDWRRDMRLSINLLETGASQDAVFENPRARPKAMALVYFEGSLHESKTLVIQRAQHPDLLEWLSVWLGLPLVCPCDASSTIGLHGAKLYLDELKRADSKHVIAALDGIAAISGVSCHPPIEFWVWWTAICGVLLGIHWKLWPQLRNRIPCTKTTSDENRDLQTPSVANAPPNQPTGQASQ